MNASYNTSAGGEPIEDWEAPSDELVSQVLMRLGDVQHRKIFYAGLDNPKWVRALAARNVFDKAPESTVGDGNQPRGRLWPEGDYLARMAAVVPEEVAPLFEQVAATDNIWVQQVIVRGVASMPGEQATKLARFIVEYMKWPYRAYLEPGKLVAIANSLESSAHKKQALALLSALYRPQRNPDATNIVGHLTVQAGLGDDAYGRWLPKSVPVLVSMGEKGLGTVVSWLVEYERLTRSQTVSADYDLSHIWRPAIAPSDQNRTGDEIGHALVDATFSIAKLLQGEISLEVILAKLEATRETLLRRIALELLAQSIDVEGELSHEVLELALERLTNRCSLVVGLWGEYAPLARIALSKAPPNAVATWVAFVHSDEIYPPEQEIREILAYSDRAADEVTTQEVTDYRNRRRCELLTAIGEAWLSDDLADEFRQLTARYGSTINPTEPSPTRISGFVGPTSPVSQTELEDLTTDELIAYLSSWRPATDRMWGPSVEGLAREVEQLVRNDPDRLAERAFAMRELPIAYIQAALSGWTQAIADGKTFPMTSVWALTVLVAQQSDVGSEHPPGFRGGGGVWRYAQQASARLVSTYLRQDRALSADLAQWLWRVLRPLTRHEDPTLDREAGALSGGMDPLTLSLNSTRPIALRVAAQLLNALDRHDLLDETPDLLGQILQELEGHVGPSADASLATAAVFGEVIGVLINTSPDWVNANAAILFGGIASTDPRAQAWSDSVFSVAVAAYRPSLTLLRFMRPWFEASFEPAYLARNHTVGWRNFRSPAQHVGDHILLLYIHGLIERDDALIRLLFSNTTSEARGDVLGHLGWQFMHTDREEPVKARAQALISWRVEEIRSGRASVTELNGFYWWVRANRFPADWWLPILDLATSDTDFDPHGMIGTSLAEAARHLPRETVLLLARLLTSRNHPWERYDLIESAPPILASALDSDDETARETARTLMDRLGREGFTDLDESVSRYQAG